MSRLEQKYKDEVTPALRQQFGYSSPMAVPKVSKVVINMGVGEAIADAKLLDQAVDELATICGQRPAITRAKKSISNFKLREGMSIGCRVTLRGRRMYEFLDRLMNLALPRVRDFRGVSNKAFDIVTTAQTDQEALVLLGGLGMPFSRGA
jgi:large subunit ribosomal protein L5